GEKRRALDRLAGRPRDRPGRAGFHPRRQHRPAAAIKAAGATPAQALVTRYSSLNEGLIAFNKPFNVLRQFTDGAGRRTLADFITVKDVYPAGRLDYDSEGLLLLTDEGPLQKRIADPRHKMKKTYLVQVERVPDEKALALLRRGVKLSDGITKP